MVFGAHRPIGTVSSIALSSKLPLNPGKTRCGRRKGFGKSPTIGERPGTGRGGYTAFHASSLDAAGFEGDKEAFLGVYGELSRPAAVERGVLSNSYGKWTDAIGSIHVKLKIPAGESRQASFVLGAVEAGL